MPVNGQLGIKSESTWGTAPTVTLFPAGLLEESLVREDAKLVSRGMRAGRRTPACISTGVRTCGGSVKLELYPQPLATILRHMFGTIATTGAGPYTHTASPGPLDGKSLALQVGVPGYGGTTHTKTVSGGKFEGWSLKSAVGEIATLDLTVTAKDYVTNVSLASASYPAVCPFTFIHGSVTINSVAQASVTSFELSCKRSFRKSSALGVATVMEQKELGAADFEIMVECEFDDLTLHDLANTAVPVVLAFSDGTNSLTVTMNAWVDPQTPTLGGIDSETKYQFKATPYHATSDASAIQAVLINSETTSA